MRRWVVLALLTGLGVTAGAASFAREEELPLPPIPPDSLMDSEAAPIPNNGIRAPLDVRTPTGEAQLSPTLMGPKYTYQGEAFLRGSTVQTEQNRNAKPAAGFNLKVPLQ
jgi:hypothetical protein